MDRTNRSADDLRTGDLNVGPYKITRQMYPPELVDFAALKGLTVLDACCGGGRFVVDLIEQYGIDAIGFDAERPAAADYYPRQLFTANQMYTALPSGSIDIIYSTFGPFAYGHTIGLVECVRVLKLQGELRATGFDFHSAQTFRAAIEKDGRLAISHEWIIGELEVHAFRVVKTKN